MRLARPGRRALGTATRAAILILVILAAGGAYVYDSNLPAASRSIGTTAVSRSSPATSSSQSASGSLSSNQTRSSAESATFSTTTGDSVVIAVSKAISDQIESQEGYSIYIYDVSLEDDGQSSYPVSRSFFTMESSSGAEYGTVSVSAIQVVLPSLTMTPGQVVGGQLAFQFPNSQTPSRLEYAPPGALNETISNLPLPSGTVSEPSGSVIINVDYASDVTGYQDLYAYPYIDNDTLFFYTGQAISVVVPLLDVNIGSTVTVYSIASATPGLNIVQTSPSFPIIVVGTSGGDETNLIVSMPAPPAPFTGAITLNVTADEDCC